MWILRRNDTDELTTKKETHRLRELIYGCWWEGWGELCDGHVYSAILKVDNQQGPTV